MNITTEIEQLQSYLTNALELLTEAKTTCESLSDCSSYEIDKQISLLLSICKEGKYNLQKSYEHIEILHTMMGIQSSLTTAVPVSLARGKSQQENTVDDQIQLANGATLIDSATKELAQQVKNLTESLRENIRKGVSATMICTSMYAGLVMKSYPIWVDVLNRVGAVNSPFQEIDSELKKVGMSSGGQDLQAIQESELEARKPPGSDDKKKKKK